MMSYEERRSLLRRGWSAARAPRVVAKGGPARQRVQRSSSFTDSGLDGRHADTREIGDHAREAAVVLSRSSSSREGDRPDLFIVGRGSSFPQRRRRAGAQRRWALRRGPTSSRATTRWSAIHGRERVTGRRKAWLCRLEMKYDDRDEAGRSNTITIGGEATRGGGGRV